jgi:hypothetical protein
MLYICIFSNKLDLNQAIRVSHNRTALSSAILLRTFVSSVILESFRCVFFLAEWNVIPLCIVFISHYAVHHFKGCLGYHFISILLSVILQSIKLLTVITKSVILIVALLMLVFLLKNLLLSVIFICVVLLSVIVISVILLSVNLINALWWVSFS